MASATAATMAKQQQREACESEISDLPSSPTHSSQTSSAYDDFKELQKEGKQKDSLMDHQRRGDGKNGNINNNNDQLSPPLTKNGAAVGPMLDERSFSTASEGPITTTTLDTSTNALAATVTCDNSSSDAMSICSTSPPGSTDFLPMESGNSVPQWKKDLLQRRKTNVARTIGANQSMVCTKKDSSTFSSLSPLSTSPVAPLPSAASIDVEDRARENTKIAGVCIKSNSMDNVDDGSNNKCSNISTNNTKICASHFVNVKTPAVIQQNISVSSVLPSSASFSSSSSSLSGHYTPSLSNSSKPEGISMQQQQNVVTSSKSTIKTNTSQQQQEQKQYHSSKTYNSNQSTTAISYSKTKSTSGGSEGELKCINNNSNNNSDNNNTSETCLTTLQEQQQQQQQKTPDYNELQQQPFQLHSKLDANNTGASCRGALIGISTSVTTKSISSTTTSFIKNPAASKYSKVNKYKLSAKSSNSSSTIPTNLTVISTPSKKMVAVQEVNENSSNTASTGNLDFDFDPSEELQYGPGIVSKLRCRYLSLALRQSNGKQRPPLDNLRRATSLNNLLDNDATEDDCNIANSGVNNCINNRDHKIISNKINSGQQRVILNQLNQQIEQNSYHNTTPDEFVATFQKNIKLFEKDKQSIRSRQVKRGNDSLKRARSVEALLVSSSPLSSSATSPVWNKESCNTVNGGGIPISKNNLRLTEINQSEYSSITSSCDVTIEDKILNGRERISIEKTPKRLTSIIDDAEKPPPDLVKQTLKIFEATANRRGRGLSRNNGTGEVAAKVASYKSIISQEKPPIIFPKPPLSPKKIYRNKPTSLDIGKRIPSTAASAITNAAVPMKRSSTTTTTPSPIVNITKKFSGCDLKNNKNGNVNSNDGEISVICSPTTVGNSEKHSSSSPQSSSPLEDAMTAVTLGHRASSGINIHETGINTECATGNSVQNSFDTNNYNDGNDDSDNIPAGNKNQNHHLRRTPPNIIPRKHYETSLNNSSLADSSVPIANQQKISLKTVEGLTSDGRILSSPLPLTIQSSSSLLHGIISTSTPIQNILRQRNISESEESTDSIDDHRHDQAHQEQQVIKRVSKLALENISKAGCTQHFSFNKETAITTRSSTIAATGSPHKVSSLTSSASATTVASLATSSSLINGNGSNSLSGIDSQQSLGTTNSTVVSSGGGAGSITSPNTTKQIGVIRPLVTTDVKIHQQQQQLLYKEQHKSNENNKPKSDNDLLDSSIAIIEECTNGSLNNSNSRISRDNLAISKLSQSNSTSNINNISNSPIATSAIINNNNHHHNSNSNINTSSNNNNNNIRRTSPLPLPSSVATVSSSSAVAAGMNENNRPILTSREIEKNFINEKKTEAANLESTINNQSKNDSHGEFPIKWQLGKKKSWHSANSAQSQNNCMVFNFKDRKEVPDYIENDGLLFKRRRELPKPNEAGFVLLDNLNLDTSTDPDDSWKSMGPPSPCNVEFENANVIIDGKSSIRYKSRGEISLRVQFDDTLTSTFEYPSETSLLEDSPTNDFQLTSHNKDVQDSGKMNLMPSAVAASLNKNINFNISESSSNVSHATVTYGKEYIPTVEEIIQLPPSGPKLLGNMSLGSAPLANYTPVKAQINTNFELGVTRPTMGTIAASSSAAGGEKNKSNSENMNGNSSSTSSSNGSVGNDECMKRTSSNTRNDHLDIRNSNNDRIDDIFRSNNDENTADNDSLPYLKPASDDLTIAYSEGTKKTDLLY